MRKKFLVSQDGNFEWSKKKSEENMSHSSLEKNRSYMTNACLVIIIMISFDFLKFLHINVCCECCPQLK